MKKILGLLLVIVLMLSLGACGNKTDDGKKIEELENVEMAITLLDGTVREGMYTGEAVEGKMHGQGSFSAENSSGEKWSYTGTFENGTICGEGTMEWETGLKRIGTFKNEVLSGQGTVYYNDILLEEGAYENDILNGQGKIYDEYGELIYEGLFENGRPAVNSVGLNEKINFADWEYECVKAEEHTSVGKKNTQEKYIVYLINATNNSKGSRELGSFFMLEDNEGRVYEMDTDVSLDYHQVFDTENWHLDEVGASLTAYSIPIAFEVPKDAKGLKLIPSDGYYKKVAAIEVEVK